MKLSPQIVGKRRFDERPVTATDPCYTADTWCALRGIKVKPGEYVCVAWKGYSYYKNPFTGKRERDERVYMCGIYHEDIAQWDTLEYIGDIGVDAGLAGFFQDKPDYDDSSWSGLLRALGDANYAIVPEGFFTSSGMGDGVYPVYAKRDESGEIAALEICFGDEAI